jgi:hypothetical protein
MPGHTYQYVVRCETREINKTQLQEDFYVVIFLNRIVLFIPSINQLLMRYIQKYFLPELRNLNKLIKSSFKTAFNSWNLCYYPPKNTRVMGQRAEVRRQESEDRTSKELI